jgi:hypothetical protein
MAFARHVLPNNRNNLILGRILDMERAGLTVALYKGKNRILMATPALNLKAVLAANVGFINLDNAASATHGRESAVSHCLTDTVSEKPSGFHAARKHPLDLIGRDALLAGARQVDNLKPQMQRQVGTLKDGSLSNGELSLALVAFVKAKAGSLALHLADALGVGIAAMRANRPSRPKPVLYIRESSVFVDEVGGVEDRGSHESKVPKEFDGVSFVRVPLSVCARSVTPTFSFRPASSEHCVRPVYFPRTQSDIDLRFPDQSQRQRVSGEACSE